MKTQCEIIKLISSVVKLAYAQGRIDCLEGKDFYVGLEEIRVVILKRIKNNNGQKTSKKINNGNLALVPEG